MDNGNITPVGPDVPTEGPLGYGFYTYDPVTGEVTDFEPASGEEIILDDDDDEEDEIKKELEKNEKESKENESDGNKETESETKEPGGQNESGETSGEGAADAGGEGLTEGGLEGAGEGAAEGIAEGGVEGAEMLGADVLAVETAAAPEEAVGCIGFLFGTPVGWFILAVLAVIILVVIITMFSMMGSAPDEAAATTTSTCTSGTINYGSPNKDGYYQLPTSSNYDLNVSGGTPRAEQWGGKTLIETIDTVATTWNAKHPTERLGIGDLNASGHLSHQKGIDVDIFSLNAIFMSTPGHVKNPKYDKNLAIELGKMIADTGTVEYIFYNDPAVNSAVNSYMKSKKLPGKIEPWSGHDDHFHLRVTDGAKVKGSTNAGATCPITTSSYTPPADVLKYCGTDHGFYNTSSAMKIFGSSESEVSKQLVSVPFPVTSKSGKILVHKKAAPCFEQVGKEIVAAGIKYKMTNDGTFNWRQKAGGGSLSMHSFGIAFDINAGSNPWQGGSPKHCKTDIPKEVVTIFHKYGFSWGGEWNSVCDAMHFEWHGATK
jgi:murein endopeptidase